MTEIGFFPSLHYAPGKVFTFMKPKHTEWTIIKKLDQQSYQQDEADLRYGYVPSFASATFLVRSNLDEQEAFMRVYQQVPSKGTEFDPPEERATQADGGYHGEFEAMKAFHEQKSTITPALLGYKEEAQDPQGIIPGGYLIQFVFERVPGVPLAEDRIVPRFGAPLHSFFQKFNDIERKEIRKHFDEGYRKLQELGWEPAYPWANNLIWDSSSKKLYFVDFRNSRRTDGRDEDVEDSDEESEEEEVPMSMIWDTWGLAIAPNNPKDQGDLSKWTL